MISHPFSKAELSPLAVTMGEPAGIGGEITCKAWLKRDEAGIAPFFVIDDPDRLAAVSYRISMQSVDTTNTLPIQIITKPEETTAVFDHALPVLPEFLAVKSVPGHPDSANADAVIASIKRAVTFACSKRVCAVVTNPIHKKTLYQSGFCYPGHTEFLATLTDPDSQPVMMLVSSDLRVVPVTVHDSLQQALSKLETSSIVTCGRATMHALRFDFGITAPRLAVAALNPHAGEGGYMGYEEITLIKPAIKELQTESLNVFGPLPADTLFHAKARSKYDAVLCMYHDQALIPLKTIDFNGGVNVTLGLPFVRTSPDHGTALDIAGGVEANESSLIQALRLAYEIATRRLLSTSCLVSL